MAKKFKFECGSIVKDEITGFQGVVMGRTEYITGCLQYAICPRKLEKDGKLPDWHWFDEDRLQATGKKIKLPGTPDATIIIHYTGKVKSSEPIGGPQPVAPSR